MERQFSHKSPEIIEGITEVADDIVKSSLIDEVVLRIRDIMKGRYNNEFIEENVKVVQTVAYKKMFVQNF